MKKTFIESRGFTGELYEWLDDDTFFAMQNELMEDPEKGVVMPGCGGLRKVRVADPKRQKGKRGGLRVIYLHVPEVDCILLLDIYGKGEQDDLNAAERRTWKRLAEAFKKEILKRMPRRGE